MSVPLGIFWQHKRLTKIFVSLFIFALQKHTTLLAKYSVLYFYVEISRNPKKKLNVLLVKMQKKV